MKNYKQHHKNLTRDSPKRSNIAGSFCPPIKKTITEVLLILLLYLILFFIWWQFRHLIKIMADVGDILNDNDFFGDVVDTPKEGIEQHKKRECLKDVISMGKAHLLGHKWTHGRVDKVSNEIINKTYAEYRQHELNKKVEKTGRALGKHVINLYTPGISRWLKIKDVKKLRQDIENDPIIKDQIANLGCRFVCMFGDYLAPVLIAAHTASNVDFGGEPEDKGYESEA